MFNFIKAQIKEQRWIIVGTLVLATLWYAAVVRPNEQKLYSIIECTKDGTPEEFNRCANLSL